MCKADMNTSFIFIKRYIIDRVVETHWNYIDPTAHALGVLTTFSTRKFTSLVGPHFANDRNRGIKGLSNTGFKTLEEERIDRKAYLFQLLEAAGRSKPQDIEVSMSFSIFFPSSNCEGAECRHEKKPVKPEIQARQSFSEIHR
jgi:hypothetical protein